MKNISPGKNDIDITSEIKLDEPFHNRQFSEASLNRISYKEVLRKYAANLKENIHTEV